jgi:hypothetical protein
MYGLKNYYFEIRSWLEKYSITLSEPNRSNVISGENVTNYAILMYKLTTGKYKARDKENLI